MTNRSLLPRRTFLRGALATGTVALALPPLEAMYSSRALAGGVAPEPIFGIFFWANGLPWNSKHSTSAAPDPGFDPSVSVDLWTPNEIGPYTPSTLLSPLAAHAPNVITGLEPKTDWVTGGETDGHMRGFMVALTSDRVNPEGFYHNSHTLTASRESLDQFVAKHDAFYASGVPRFRSLVLGVSPARFHQYGHWNSISYNGPNSLNPPIMDPGQLFNLLFAPPGDATVLERRAKVLDAVLDDYHSLRTRLGAADRARIDAHVEHIDEVQRRLELSTLACEGPAQPPATSSDLLTETSNMADLLALGLKCGITRVFSFMLTSPATTHLFSNIGDVVNDMHTTCHAGQWGAVRDITHYQMQAFAILLDKLAAVEVAPGVTALDASLVYGTSEYGEGWKHGVQEMPVVLAGKAAGRLKTGIHVREVAGNMAKAHVTVLRGLGLDIGSYGFHASETSDDFGADLYTAV
ncbi:MAG: DUF1552 domain-containing protein [Polyangiaceae bacterium]|nr:DUF1552 domain-containing protein [Polyangiaceae bacterium]